MANLPASGYLSDAIRSEAEMQQAFEDQRDFISQLPASAEVQLTISAGTITPATRGQGSVKVETEAAAASDDLANIAQTNVQDGALLLMRAADAAHTVVVKHAAGGAGQLMLQYDTDFSLDDTDKWLLLKRVGTNWEEVLRSYGNDPAAERAALGCTPLYGAFYKSDPSTVAFTKTGAGTAQIKAGTKIDVAGTLVEFASATSITMPTLTAGTDYAIWVKDDATIQADASFTSAPGAGNWRKIGGFHYAPGGNATGVAGGDTTAAINAYSFWDLKFKPACPDPRGMALVADSFWADIYLLGVDHLTNGTSKYNVSIADGSAPPKIPTKFGGSGSSAYSTLNWWEAAEVMQSWGKRLPTYDEFAALAYGTTEAQSSGGTDVPTTGVNGTGYANTWNEFTSKWGVIQATGCMWIWGGEFGGPYGTAAFTANTGGRGSTYNLSNAVLVGGTWDNAAGAGSRASAWNNSPAASGANLGARGVCDHLILE